MKIKFLSLILVAVTIIMLLGFTSPKTAPSYLYLSVFVFVYIFFFILLLLIIDLAYSHLQIKMRIFCAAVLGFTPTIILALASLGDMKFVDVLLAMGLPALVAWYGLKRKVIK